MVTWTFCQVSINKQAAEVTHHYFEAKIQDWAYIVHKRLLAAWQLHDFFKRWGVELGGDMFNILLYYYYFFKWMLRNRTRGSKVSREENEVTSKLLSLWLLEWEKGHTSFFIYYYPLQPISSIAITYWILILRPLGVGFYIYVSYIFLTTQWGRYCYSLSIWQIQTNVTEKWSAFVQGHRADVGAKSGF